MDAASPRSAESSIKGHQNTVSYQKSWKYRPRSWSSYSPGRYSAAITGGQKNVL